MLFCIRNHIAPLRSQCQYVNRWWPKASHRSIYCCANSLRNLVPSQKKSHQFAGRYRVIALMLLGLLMLAGQKGYWLSQAVGGLSQASLLNTAPSQTALSHAAFSQTAMLDHCAPAAGCHHGMETTECCTDAFTECALDCAQVSAWLPATATRLHLKQVRAVPPPFVLSLPEPLAELPYQPPRLSLVA